jgi:ABC-2 type transport system ATP-binding protein
VLDRPASNVGAVAGNRCEAVPVRFARVSYNAGTIAILRNIDLTLDGLGPTMLIGPNGSGKTTLFQCFAGVAPATLGTVTRDAAPIAPDDRKRLLFFVPDGVRPWGDQSVAWTLRFTAGLHGAPRERVEAVSASLALAPLMNARLRELSKGEHRRVVLAIGLLTPHPLLLLDEPFDGLDLRQTRDAMAVLREHATHRTLFLSIHQLGDAERVCDRFVLLSAGRVAGEGTLDELRARAELTTGGLEEVFLALT